MSATWKLVLESVLTGIIVFCTAMNLYTTVAVNEAADKVQGERASDDERTRLVNAARQKQIVNEATLLYRQEQCHKSIDRLVDKLKGLGD